MHVSILLIALMLSIEKFGKADLIESPVRTCGEYIYKGKKFNARKETVDGEEYYGIKVSLGVQGGAVRTEELTALHIDLSILHQMYSMLRRNHFQNRSKVRSSLFPTDPSSCQLTAFILETRITLPNMEPPEILNPGEIPQSKPPTKIS